MGFASLYPSYPLSMHDISFSASGARVPAILDNKDPDAPSLFEPAALLRQARRQKGLPVADVPRLCVLDPDGDIVRRLQHSGEATRAADWPCYHTDLYLFRLAGETAG